MARTKNTAGKVKEMFKRYNPDDVPDIMPFPGLASVATTRSEETAVPKLNDHQRSWILDVALRNTDLPNLTGKAVSELYEQVKNDAFDAKAFKHQTQSQDAEEEAHLPSQVAAWKRKQREKKNPNGKGAEDDDDSSDEEEEDEGGRAALLRGYTRVVVARFGSEIGPNLNRT
ncbi:hypothetical protein B0H19DRAFT_1375709 [Mycena capillaripes]|nr:hypothetical protein B0H19DRAFT_1375709 [Mycena capillaripes]